MTNTAEQLQIDRSKLEISKTDVAIEIKNMHKWYG
ncbi:ABC transporter ATP-binding protein, partial [Brucella pseudogrignonensis]